MPTYKKVLGNRVAPVAKSLRGDRGGAGQMLEGFWPPST